MASEATDLRKSPPPSRAGCRRCSLPYGSAAPRPHPIYFEVQALEHPAKVEEKSVFLVPR